VVLWELRRGVGGGVVGGRGIGSGFGLPGSGFRLPKTLEGNDRGGAERGGVQRDACLSRSNRKAVIYKRLHVPL
jgi:hypothetical protein